MFNHHQTMAIFFGIADKIGQSDACFSFANAAQDKQTFTQSNMNYRLAFGLIVETLKSYDFFDCITGIGHRVVHGGHLFNEAVIVDQSVITKIKQLIPLAPLHNPANLAGIEFCLTHFPHIPQVAMFDTAFHHSIPEHIHRYAIQDTFYYDQHVRKYGFHGISHHYVAKNAAQYLDIERGNFISAHLGNGCSITAIKEGKSIDTSMGFTPLDGLVMGTRSGGIDPGIFQYLHKQLKISIDEITTLLNRQGGLLALCGKSDMRDISKMITQGNKKAETALAIFCHRAASFIASYMMYFDRFDGLIFTAGIGENSALVRQKIINNLNNLGFKINDKCNQAPKTYTEIQAHNSKRIMVLPTNEELMIAQACQHLI